MKLQQNSVGEFYLCTITRFSLEKPVVFSLTCGSLNHWESQCWEEREKFVRGQGPVGNMHCEVGCVQGQILTLPLIFSCMNWDTSLFFSEPHLTVCASWTFWIIWNNTGKIDKYTAGSLKIFMEPEYKHTISHAWYSENVQSPLIWLSAHTDQSTQVMFFPDSGACGVPDRQGGMLPYLFFLLPETSEQAGTLLMHPRGHRGQAQLDVRAGCCGELFSTPSLR